MAPRNAPSDGVTEGLQHSTGSGESTKKKEIYFDGYFYDVTNFVYRHPGGKVINFYTEAGEDATQAIQQFHYRSKDKVRLVLQSLTRRPAQPGELNVDPELQKRNQALSDDFAKLYRELEQEGYMKPSFVHIAYRLSTLLAMFLTSTFLVTRDNFYCKVLGGTLLGLTAGQCGWLQHEGGHRSLTGWSFIDKATSVVVWALFLGGSSYWWTRTHVKHHAMPQRLHHDKELDTMPVFAFSTNAATDLKEGRYATWGNSFTVKYQKWLFIPMHCFIVILSWNWFFMPRKVIKKRLYWDMALIGLHYIYVWYITIPVYLLSFWVVSSYMILNLALSHTHLPVAKEPRHWVEYALVHTTDIEPSWFVNWWMGYLNCQIEHHLFPAMPQFRQPQIRDRVRALAEKHDLPYHTMSYFEAVQKTLDNLGDVSELLQQLG